MKAVLFDLDGVLYTGLEAIPGAAEVLQWVKKENIPHMFLTNTTSKTPKEIIDKLGKMEINIDEEHLWTPVKAAAQWLKDQKIYGPVGLFMKDNVKKEFGHVEVTTDVVPGIRAVLVADMVEKWNIDQMNLALRMLLNAPDSLLIALGMTRYYMSPDGYKLDVGSIVKCFEYATGKEPVVLGKPAREFFNTALEKINVLPNQAVMIGDDILSDIGGARDAGIDGILVKTGKFRESDLVSGIEPIGVIDSIAEFPKWFEEFNI